MGQRRADQIMEVIRTYSRYFTTFIESPVINWCEKWKWSWNNQLQHSAV